MSEDNMTTDATAVPSEDAIEQECPECGALCLVDDGNYVALESLPVQAEEAPQNHGADVRNALVSLECVRQWLNGGCDPKAAAIEVAGIMRMLQGAPASEVQAAGVQEMVYPAEFTDDLQWILGLICFQCIHYAQALRKAGREIPNKAEAEQAATLDWMLRHYLRDPENWRANAAAEMRAMTHAASAWEQS